MTLERLEISQTHQRKFIWSRIEASEMSSNDPNGKIESETNIS